MHPEVDELRPKLKEILYDCAVEIRATKAALYLLDSGTKKFELTTEFGFRSAVRQSAGANDPMVDRCARGRSPFFVNNPATEPRLSELLFESGTERLMGVPLFSRGLLVGFIDMRDKTQKQQFDQADAGKAQGIADRILALFSTKNIWNQRFITMSDSEMVRVPQVSAQPEPAPGAAPLRPDEVQGQMLTAARTLAERLRNPPPPAVIGPSEMAAIYDTLRAMLLLPGAIVVAFSATGDSGGAQEIASRGTMTRDALAALQLKLQTWMTKRGETAGTLRTTLHTPLGVTMEPVTPQQMEKVYTATVSAGNFRGLYLTVAFSGAPERDTHELLAAMLNQLQTSIESSTLLATLHDTRIRIAERLVEPEHANFPDLRRHSMSVLELTSTFARSLALTTAEMETVTLTAMVHDCGMRLLDYDRLYRKRDLSHDELVLLREHVTVGASIVEPLLGSEIARAVLCHHERVDGAGYPNELRGEEIPLASRILQICDAFITITDPATYQMPEAPAEALAAIRRGAGAQFDAQLAVRFEEMMRPGARSTTLASQ